jgi:hypothetical protein
MMQGLKEEVSHQSQHIAQQDVPFPDMYLTSIQAVVDAMNHAVDHLIEELHEERAKHMVPGAVPSCSSAE